MRKFMMTCSLLAVSLLAGCHDDEEGEESLPEADYTVMLYGTGGGSLDYWLRYNIDQVVGYGYSPKVRFTALVKYSAKYQEEESLRGTRLLTMGEDGMTDEQVADAGYRLDNPDHLAAFIKNATERLPAKKYILVLSDHGIGFYVDDQPLDWSDFPPGTRSMITDDNCMDEYGYGESMSIFELEEGLKRSGVKLEMLYWQACQMNMIECLYQVKDYTRYSVGSAHAAPDVNLDCASLMHVLENHEGIEEAMREYVPVAMARWENSWLGERDSRFNCDLTLLDMSKIDAVVESFVPFSRAIVDFKRSLVDEQYILGFDFCQKESSYVFSEGHPSIDMVRYARQLTDRGIGDGELSAAVTRFERATREMIVVQACLDYDGKLPANGVSVGISLMTREDYEWKYPSLEKRYCDIYPLLRFDEVTRWSEFLKINDMKNVMYDKENGIFVEVPREEN